MKVNDIRNFFVEELKNNRVVSTHSGKMIEIIGASFEADEEAIFGVPNQEYINAEIKWYETQSNNINDLAEIYGKSPAAWQYSANKNGEINSNYGLLIFSEQYHNQYRNVLRELCIDQNSRRASMIYTRPSIWVEYNQHNKNDFICTNSVTYYIRDGELHCVVQMRSNDCIFGYRNDYAWQEYVQSLLVSDLRDRSLHVRQGKIFWQVQNLHVYERHFDLVQ